MYSAVHIRFVVHMDLRMHSVVHMDLRMHSAVHIRSAVHMDLRMHFAVHIRFAVHMDLRMHSAVHMDLHIPVEHYHAIKALTELTFIEVQCGNPLIEEDIERFEWYFNE